MSRHGRLHEEEWALQSFFAEVAKHVHFWAVMNMFQEDTWVFAAPDPAVDYMWDICHVTSESHIEP
jgi:hypothetical protein